MCEMKGNFLWIFHSQAIKLKHPIPTCTLNQLNQIHAHLLKTHKPPLIFNTLLPSLAPQDALLLYNQMVLHHTSHNHFTFTHALIASSSLHALHKTLEIHARAIKSGHYSDIFIQNTLLHSYVVENNIVFAKSVFKSISSPDVVSWTSIISGLSKCGFDEEAIGEFLSMDVKPNTSTLVSVVSACCGLRAVRFGKAIHGYSLRSMDGDNIILDNALLDFYVKCGYLVSAKYLFMKMFRRDVISWTTMVGGLAQGGLCEEAVEVFQAMVKGGEAVPNEVTLVNVLTACSSLSALNLGRWVHSYISIRYDLVVDGNVGNALINMYAKCSDMYMAVRVFNELTHKDMISWSTIIGGMAMNGHGMHALQFFSLMLVHGVSPDDVTFIGLLSACSHAGLVEQGLIFFKAMNDVYGIAPQMQHYACMVDMYGRAGLLEEAEAFIRGMPMEAEGPIWGALLNACKIHGNEKMFGQINQSLRNAKGVSIGTLALLSNTYASSNRWDDANKVRDMMRDMGLKKMSGCSWIEVDAMINRYDGANRSFAFAGK